MDLKRSANACIAWQLPRDERVGGEMASALQCAALVMHRHTHTHQISLAHRHASIQLPGAQGHAYPRHTHTRYHRVRGACCDTCMDNRMHTLVHLACPGLACAYKHTSPSTRTHQVSQARAPLQQQPPARLARRVRRRRSHRRAWAFLRSRPVRERGRRRDGVGEAWKATGGDGGAGAFFALCTLRPCCYACQTRTTSLKHPTAYT